MIVATDHHGDMDEVTLRLLDEAIDLMIRRQSAPDNTVTLQTINVWRARSDTHERIWQRVADAHGLTGLAVAATPDRMSRRNVIAGAMAAVGVGVVGTWAAPRLRLRALADRTTVAAQLLPLDLPDGSYALLGPDSAIAIGRREVRLLQGMAWFDIVDNPAQFTVSLGDGVQVRTNGAAFEVSRDMGIINLAVGGRHVEMAAASHHAVSAGEWMRIDPSTDHVESGSRDPGLVGLWQQGLIVAEAEPLDTLVARIARWLPERVMITDNALGRARISGLFDMADPVRALQAAVRPTGGRIRTASGILTIISNV